jgi:DNA-binding NarL/FixJ family response regulator
LLDPGVTGSVLERIRRIASGGGTDEIVLTAHEREILPLIAAGHTNQEIAAAVFLSEKTVKNYVSAILAKLGLDRRAQVPAFMARRDAHRPGD